MSVNAGGHSFEILGEGTKKRPRFLRCKRCHYERGLMDPVVTQECVETPTQPFTKIGPV